MNEAEDLFCRTACEFKSECGLFQSRQHLAHAFNNASGDEGLRKDFGDFFQSIKAKIVEIDTKARFPCARERMAEHGLSPELFMLKRMMEDVAATVVRREIGKKTNGRPSSTPLPLEVTVDPEAMGEEAASEESSVDLGKEVAALKAELGDGDPRLLARELVRRHPSVQRQQVATHFKVHRNTASAWLRDLDKEPPPSPPPVHEAPKNEATAPAIPAR